MHQPPSRRLYRSTEHRMIAGVAGGIAEYFNADPTLVRLAFVALALIPPAGGAAVLAYLAMAIIVPERPYGED